MEEQERTGSGTHQLVAKDDVLRDFSDDVSVLWVGSGSGPPPHGDNHVVPVLDAPPSSLAFLRDYVSRSRPCVIKNAILGRCRENAREEEEGLVQGAPLTLTLSELQALVPPDLPVSVDATPDGHGDCLRRVRVAGQGDREDPARASVPFFVRPLQRRMAFSEFCRRVREPETAASSDGGDEAEALAPSQPPVSARIFEATSGAPEGGGAGAAASDSSAALPDGGVVYYSQQNDCLRQEFSPLWDLGLFPAGFPWAEEAFRTRGAAASDPRPDAVNLWIGNRRSVSSMHKDHYENLFYVLSGEKVFTLCPPCDAPFLYERPVPSGTFEARPDAEWKVRRDEVADGDGSSLAAATVHWVAADVLAKGRPDECRDFPLVRYAHPVTVRVRAGELLYLPSLWYHRVSQTCETVAVNYWYDMDFESPSWCYFRFLQQLQPEVR
jgi:jumonji domain-containing protein 7